MCMVIVMNDILLWLTYAVDRAFHVVLGYVGIPMLHPH